MLILRVTTISTKMKCKMAEKYSKYVNELIIIFISVILCACFFNNQSNLITDFGREVLIPSEILKGQILYKDILNIYGPLSYYINALALLVFGKNLNTFFLAGSLNCIIFSLAIYRLGLKFLNKNLSLYTTLLVSFYCLYGFGLYNYQHPYAYAMTYGVTFCAVSVLFLISFSENKYEKDLYKAGVFTGMAVCCKIEFIPLIFVYLIILTGCKTEIKKIFRFLLFFAIPFTLFLIPFAQGLSLNDAKNVFEIIKTETTTPSVIAFSKLTGSYFDIAEYIKGAVNTAVTFGIFGILYLIFKKFESNKTLLILLSFPFFILGLILFSGKEFALLPTVTAAALIVLLIIRFEVKYIILLCTALVCSGKTLFFITLGGYGSYTLPLFLLTLIVLFNNNKQEIRENFSKFLVVFLILIKMIPIILMYPEYNYPVKTSKGIIKTSKDWGEGIKSYIDFVGKNTNSDDKILHLQEGALLNFITDRKTDMMLYSLNLPYIETYGEDKITGEIGKFEYITLINGFGCYYFGKDNVYISDNPKNKIAEFIKNNYKIIYEYRKNGESIIFMKKQI